MHSVTKLAMATALPVSESDRRDYATRTGTERARCRFFKFKAELD